MRVEAGPLSRHLLELIGTGGKFEGGVRHFGHLLHGEGADIRSEILRIVLFLLQLRCDPGIQVLRDTDVREALVVHHQNVVLRPVLLDQGAFQRERFILAVHNDHIEIVHVGDHLRHFGHMVRPFAEVARDAQFQTLGLADVDHFILFVPHDIHAGKFRQIRCLFIQFFPVHSDLFSKQKSRPSGGSFSAITR